MNTTQTDIQERYNALLNTIFGPLKANKPQNIGLNRLKEMRELAALVGNPHKSGLKFIHVAGTNGKGSISIKTTKALQEFGFKVGTFTSPHISCFRERIQINCEMMPVEQVVEHGERVLKLAQEHKFESIRWFEVITMIGLLEFQRQKCDYVVFECGIGAHKDPTNIIDYPEVVCSTVVSIGMDHMDCMGDSIEGIATEKAGVIKSGVPVVLGPSCQGLKGFTDRIEEVKPKAAVYIPKQKTFCQDNNLVSMEILKFVSEYEGFTLDIGLSERIQKWMQPCRLERIQNREEKVVLDVCHNIDGFKAVIPALQERYPEVRNIKLIFGISKNKKLDDIVEYLENEEAVKELYVVSKPHLRLHRAEDAHKVVEGFHSKKLRELILPDSAMEILLTKSDDSHSSEIISQASVENISLSNIPSTLDFVLKEQKMGPTELVLVCGSFFIMSDVKSYFGYKEVVDNIQSEAALQ